VLFVGGFLPLARYLSETTSTPLLAQLLWVIPLSSASMSLALLVGSIALGHFNVRRITETTLSMIYLVSCPSLAILNFSTFLLPGTQPPIWVGFAAPALMLASAWAYLSSLNRSDGEVGGELQASGWIEPEV